MTDIDTTYLVLPEDDYPPSVTLFTPGFDPHRVVFSQNRFGVFDEDEGYCVSEHTDEDDAVTALHAAMVEAELGFMNEDDEFVPNEDIDTERFSLHDALWMDMAPSWFTDGEFGCRWVSTDAWRGYSQVVHNDQWEPYAAGWVTGYPDDTVQYKMTAADLFAAFTSGDIEPPFDVVWFFGVTSNVFSQSADIIIPAGRTDDFEAWLTDVSFNPEAVTHAFN